MAALHGLLIGGGLLVIALVILTARGINPTVRLSIALVLVLRTSGASALYATQRHSGTGNLISRGFPKPFHFYWRDFEGRGETRGGTNFTYYAVNTVIHLGPIAL